MQPPTLAQTRRFTCRYWALGPACPNVTRTGSIFCKYSHYDTGQLAGPFAQTGTCLNWSKHGVCYRFGCTYEHRNTGVTGLGQGGPIELQGTEADIANAAHRSGFNTNNHVALFNLIWSVKKFAIKRQRQTPRFSRPPPPPHPIYPDQYRPSGVGDNTKAKRKFTDYNPNEPLKFHPTQPLKKAGGTQANPVTIDDSDTDAPNPANSSAKRRKIDNDRSVTVNDTPVIFELLEVKSRFAASRQDMNKCQQQMKELFDKHYQTFDDDEIMRVLQELSEHMNGVFDSAKEGMEAVERAVGWVRGRDVKIE